MSLEVIYLTRHGFRSNWVVDLETGEYSANIPSPTGIPSDPALAGYGVQQAEELAEHLVTLDPPIERFYSSPFYRCIQTINPTLEKLSKLNPDKEVPSIRGENGVGEWYGTARFDHPSPAPTSLLHTLFPRYSPTYTPSILPSIHGETINELHNRTAYALHKIIEQSDREGVKAIVICTHAATLIAAGRALTGNMPEDSGAQDFRPFTCGLSKFVRKSRNAGAASGDTAGEKEVGEWKGPETPIPDIDWRDGKGVGGGWDCELNGYCGFLKGGEERGWHFSGDESFSTGPNAAGVVEVGAGLGEIVEGEKPEKPRTKERTSSSGSRL